MEHCGPNWDDHLGYRKKDELKEWMKKCPLKRYEKTLEKEKLISDSNFVKINNKIEREIEEAFRFAKLSPFPRSDALFKHVYS